jgi:hypothetical protein
VHVPGGDPLQRAARSAGTVRQTGSCGRSVLEPVPQIDASSDSAQSGVGQPAAVQKGRKGNGNSVRRGADVAHDAQGDLLPDEHGRSKAHIVAEHVGVDGRGNGRLGTGGRVKD